MKHAVIKAAGAQYWVAEGDELDIFQIEGKEGDKVDFNEVLLYESEDEVLVGQPLLKDVSVKAVIMKSLRGEKIRVATYKAKSRYRRVKGHRDELTRVKIESISMAGEKKIVKPVKVVKIVKKVVKKVTKKAK